MKPIHLFVPTFHVEETLDEIRKCLEKGWTGIGDRTDEFEEAWKAYTGVPHAHFVNSATAGLHLAIECLKKKYCWDDGDEIITTPITFISTNHAILHASMRPVFADIDEHLCIDPVSAEAHITPRTRAIMFVGLGGNTGQLKKIHELCKQRGVALIVDAAHMAGTTLDGKHIGSMGDATVFSFQAVKNLPTADSGMVCFEDPEMDKLARQLSWLGINKSTHERAKSNGYSWEYNIDNVGWKYNGNSVMAAMALVGLRHLEEDNKRRREIAVAYDDLLLHDDVLIRIPVPEECVSSRHLFQVLAKNRDALIEYLHTKSIFPGVHYKDNRLFPMYAYAWDAKQWFKYDNGKAAWANKRLLSLPMHMRMANADVERVAGTINEFYAK